MKPVCSLLVVLLILTGCNAQLPRADASGAARQTGVAVQRISKTNAETEFRFYNEPEEDIQPVFSVSSLPDEVAGLITGSSWTQESPVSLEELSYVTVTYINFDGEACTGHLIVHRSLGQELADIFQELYEAKFPIQGIGLVDVYGADDLQSMEANNTYAFCSRLILGTQRYSKHSYGIAIDINPVQNPYLSGGQVLPEEGQAYLDRENVRPGMITSGDACYNAFVSRGWIWGGHWASPDYQHFEKVLSQA